MTDKPKTQKQTDEKQAVGTDNATPGARPAETGQVTSFEKAQEEGYIGVKVDQTPNENYTVQGVTSGAPTPETDDEQKRKATERK